MIYFAITTNILYMRKVLLSIALLTTAIYTVAQQRTEADAAAIAKTFMQENGYNFDITKSTAPAKIRAKKAGEITPYYIFNDTRKGGFVIVGGQEGMSDILAYSDEECFDINDIPPTAANWLEAYTQCAIIAADEPEKSKACKREAAKAFAKSNFSLRQNVTPLLGEIKYNQMEPYNRKCPTLTVMEGGNKKTGTAITGCTQTAMARTPHRQQVLHTQLLLFGQHNQADEPLRKLQHRSPLRMGQDTPPLRRPQLHNRTGRCHRQSNVPLRSVQRSIIWS